MKQLLWFCFYFAFAKACFSQQSQSVSQPSTSPSYSIDVSYTYGTILEHNPDIAHLITGHPEGVLLRYNQRTYGDKEWESLYGFPDLGFTFTYQDLKNQSLGDAYGIYGHYNFYALNRKLQYGIGTGIAYMTNPYDPVTNFRNVAYGTTITSASYVILNYREESLFKNIGFNAGITLIHYSNGSIKEPNTSTNSFLINAGLTYSVDPINRQKKTWEKTPYSEPVHLNVLLRHGWNEINFIGSGQFPFFTLSTFADKRLSKKSSIHAGVDLMNSQFLKEYRDFLANSFASSDLTGEESIWRAGVFAGHELHLGRTSIITYLGLYIYDEIGFGSIIYNRIGLQRKLNDQLQLSLTLKSHGASAEALSLGIGYRI